MLPLRPNSPTSRLPLVGFTIIRVIVPLWIATGATMKLLAKDPGLLPRKTVFRWGIDLGIDLDVYLGSLIAIEYLLALTILLVPLLSRTAAIAQLLAFVVVLFGEMLKGNFFDCGCLGGASPPPWVMLTIDCLLLLACIVLPLPRHGGPEAGSPTGRQIALARNAVSLVVVLLMTTALTLLTFTRLGVLGGDAPAPTVAKPAAAPAAPLTVQPVAPAADPVTLPKHWFLEKDELATWIDAPWRDVDLLTFITAWPVDLDRGTHVIIFYSRTCEHCRSFFRDDVATDPTLAARVVGVEIPASATALRGDDDQVWPMPAGVTCPLTALPLGPGYFITPPLAVRIENGIITCATEGSSDACTSER